MRTGTRAPPTPCSRIFRASKPKAPEATLILSGDHIYKMDYGEMLEWHRTQQADITLATIQVPPAEAGRFGVLEIADDYQVTGFEEKPQHDHPARSRFDPSMVSASMGIYIFNTGVLLRALHEDSQDPNSTHDFGKDVIPRHLDGLPRDRLRFPRYQRQTVALLAGCGYARRLLRGQHGPGVGDSGIQPVRPALAHPHQGHAAAAGQIRLRPKGPPHGAGAGFHRVSAGCIVSGGRVVHSVLSPGVRVNSYCEVEYSILMPGVEIGRYSRIRRAIINTGVKIPELHSIGFDPDADRARGYQVTEGGVTVVGD